MPTLLETARTKHMHLMVKSMFILLVVQVRNSYRHVKLLGDSGSARLINKDNSFEFLACCFWTAVKNYRSNTY
jgi:hypothetical protein